jgi:hypothetical protein
MAAELTQAAQATHAANLSRRHMHAASSSHLMAPRRKQSAVQRDAVRDELAHSRRARCSASEARRGPVSQCTVWPNVLSGKLCDGFGAAALWAKRELEGSERVDAMSRDIGGSRRHARLAVAAKVPRELYEAHRIAL